MKDVSIVLCPFKNNMYFKRVLEQVITKTDYDLSKVEIIVIDNNVEPELQIEVFNIVSDVRKSGIDVKHYVNSNIGQLAQATNKAIELADSKWFVYLCATNTYIFQRDWLTYMTSSLSDEAYAEGYVLAGTLSAWPNFLPDPKLHIHAQGGIFIARTEYMKENRYTPQYPFSFMDVIHSAHALAKGKKIKSLPEMLSTMAIITNDWMENIQKGGKLKIVHAHGCEHYPG